MTPHEYNPYPENLDVQPPEQATLRSLVEKITDLTDLSVAHDIRGKAFGRAVSMYEVMVAENGTARGTRMLLLSHFVLHEEPNLVASITHSELAGFSGDRLLTKYDVRDTEQRLHIDKHIRNIHIYNDARSAHFNAISVAEEAKRRVVEMNTARAEEDAIGLNFVSEAEARALFRMMQNDFVPFGKKKLR